MPFSTAKNRFGRDLIDVSSLKGVIIELRYNGTNNFMKEDLYQGFAQAYLHKLAFEKLQKAIANLTIERPRYSLLIFDALRPRSVQKKMRAFVAGSPYQEYVADPDKGSLHNFGMAVDLTIADENKKELDMGTPFDDFSDLAQPQLEENFLRDRSLSEQQYQNRLLLRRSMCEAGFEQLPHEWWHYNAFPADYVRGNFAIVE
jgi:zinc D-Ala-D-Ala dipeptidase